jgi:hypothetical protein
MGMQKKQQQKSAASLSSFIDMTIIVKSLNMTKILSFDKKMGTYVTTIETNKTWAYVLRVPDNCHHILLSCKASVGLFEP